jgi:hypothetical protein
MQSEQEFARAAAGRLARKNGHRVYDDHERVDLDAAVRAAADFPRALGIDLDRDERRATPTSPEPM